MNRPIAILAAVMVAGVGLWLFLSRNPHRIEEKEKFLANDTSQVDFVKIRNKDGEVVLKRVGSNWRLTEPLEFPANASYIKTLLDKVGDLEMESLITRTPAKFADFELGDSATYIEIGKQGGKIDKFYSGKPNETYTHTYVRREGSNEVWLVSGSPRSSFSREPDDWRDKKVLELDRTLIERILLKFPDETIELKRTISTPEMDTTLAKSDTSWMAYPQSGEPFKPLDKEFNRVFNNVAKMNSIAFLDAGSDTLPDMSKPDFTLEVFLEGNQREVVEYLLKPGDDSRYVARKNGNDQTLYVIYQSAVKNVMKRADVLKNGAEEVNPQDPSSKAKKPKAKGA